MARTIATTDADLEQLLGFVRTRHNLVLIPTRQDGRPRPPRSPAVWTRRAGSFSTYPERATTANARRDPRVSALVLSDNAWVQMDGESEILDCLQSVEPLVDYFRVLPGGPRGAPPLGRVPPCDGGAGQVPAAHHAEPVVPRRDRRGPRTVGGG